MEPIGDRISKIISNAGIKKVEFARVLNIDQSYVTQLIKGRNNPSERLVEDICQKFSIRKEWLQIGTGDMHLQKLDVFLNDPSLDAVDREILQSYVRMTPTQRAFIKSWIKSIAASIEHNEEQTTNDAKREEAHRLLDLELVAEEKDVSAYAVGSSGSYKKA